VEALNDAQYVAPLVETGDYHSSLNTKSWFYVFDYQTKNSHYKQRQGCVHGEELNYVFGLPLLAQLNSDGGGKSSPGRSKTSSTSNLSGLNFTRSEALLSRITIHFWSNFAATGDPHMYRTVTSSGDVRINRSKNLQWERYDPNYKKYLSIGLKPKMRDHYKPQKMALWLNLVPDLQSAAAAKSPSYFNNDNGGGGNGGGTRVNGDDSNEQSMLDYRLYSEMLPFVPNLKNIDKGAVASGSTPASSEVLDHGHSGASGNGSTASSKAKDFKDTASAAAAAAGTSGGNTSYVSFDSSQMNGFASYSTALSVTIAIGCSLLVLNVLIFTALYYRKDRRHHNGGGGGQGGVSASGNVNAGRDSDKMDNSGSMMSCKLSQQQQREQQRQLQMSSISQYVERRPSDTNCLQVIPGASPTHCESYKMAEAISSSSSSLHRRSVALPDNMPVPLSQQAPPPPPPPPGLPTTTITVGMPPGGGGVPRKSALKQGQQQGQHKGGNSSGGTSSFHAHLPPPEFADLPSPPPSIIMAAAADHGGSHSRSSSNELIGLTASDHQPLIRPGSRNSSSSSFRTLPRQANFRGPAVGGGGSESPPPLQFVPGQQQTPKQQQQIVIPHLGSAHVNHHQTLPLKSNLKKPGGGGGGGGGHKLQWNQSAASPAPTGGAGGGLSASRSSLEELRV